MTTITKPRLKCAFCEYRCWRYAALAHHVRISHKEVDRPVVTNKEGMASAHAKDAHKYRLYLLQEKRKVKS